MRENSPLLPMDIMKSIFGITSIFLGGTIYIGWRSQTLLMFDWFDSLRMTSFISFIRQWAQTMFGTPPDWVIFSLPNALWLFGGIFLFFSIWSDQNAEKFVWSSIFFLIAVSSELAQLGGYIPGTYDVNDVIFMLAFTLLAIFINGIEKPRRI